MHTKTARLALSVAGLGVMNAIADTRTTVRGVTASGVLTATFASAGSGSRLKFARMRMI
jgi:hypothetical protein